MPEVADVFQHSLTSAGASMKAALSGIGPKDMSREPGAEWRSLESVLGEATMVLRNALQAVVGQDDMPELPDGFEARYARWGTGVDQDIDVAGLPVIFSEHLKALSTAVWRIGAHRFDEQADESDAFDEDGVFSFTTIREMIFSASAYVHFLAGEATVVRRALDKPAAPDPCDETD